MREIECLHVSCNGVICPNGDPKTCPDRQPDRPSALWILAVPFLPLLWLACAVSVLVGAAGIAVMDRLTRS